MNYGIYKSARNAAWQCILDCGITTLPIRPAQIAAEFGIKCKKAPNRWMNGSAGKIEQINGIVNVIVNAGDGIARQRFTVMHELGHYVLGHLGESPLTRSESECRPDEEQAADRFAIDMLAPACVLWGLQIHDPDDITRLCGISMQAAQIRSQRMELLYQRNMFLRHPLERKVFEQFREFIQNNR